MPVSDTCEGAVLSCQSLCTHRHFISISALAGCWCGAEADEAPSEQSGCVEVDRANLHQHQSLNSGEKPSTGEEHEENGKVFPGSSGLPKPQAAPRGGEPCRSTKSGEGVPPGLQVAASVNSQGGREEGREAKRERWRETGRQGVSS